MQHAAPRERAGELGWGRQGAGMMDACPPTPSPPLPLSPLKPGGTVGIWQARGFSSCDPGGCRQHRLGWVLAV